MIRTIQEKEIRFFTINAFALARELGLGNRINMIMQSAFFALAGIIPMEEAVRYLKEEVVKNYGHQGQEVIEKNFAAIDAAPGCLKEVDVKTLRAEGKRPGFRNGQDRNRVWRTEPFCQSYYAPNEQAEG